MGEIAPHFVSKRKVEYNRRYKNIKEPNNEMMTTLAYYVSSWVGPQKGELSICIWSTQHERTNETMAEFVKSSF
jgi:hypothetical protein